MSYNENRERLSKVLGSKDHYGESLHTVQKYNAKLLHERRTRFPLVDSHTGVLQSQCDLWKAPTNRLKPIRSDQVVTYPARKWRRKCRASPSCDPNKSVYINGTDGEIMKAGKIGISASDEYPIIEIENPAAKILDYNDDVEYEEKPNKSQVKLFNCEMCHASYRSKPGLAYHLKKMHASKPNVVPVNNHVEETTKPLICDFCLGDENNNRKTCQPESMLACSECGRAAHGSCLQFSPAMVGAVKKYRWQCMECKTCTSCGSADNDHQLLFCDLCDRGFHMYCLNPPLYEPPEGDWHCHLCTMEFHRQSLHFTQPFY